MTPPPSVLLVEDDPMIAKTLQLSLRYQGFDLALAASVGEASQRLGQARFDLVMLDLGLPDGSGLDLCRRLRERDDSAALPILMLTAVTDEATAAACLDAGADDYIRKPYGLQELVARMRRLLQRGQRAREHASFGALAIDLPRRSALVGGAELKLGKREFEILAALVRAGGDAVTREQLLGACGHDEPVYDRTIDSHLSHLRRKLKDAGAAVRISAIYGVGYKLEEGG